MQSTRRARPVRATGRRDEPDCRPDPHGSMNGPIPAPWSTTMTLVGAFFLLVYGAFGYLALRP